MPLEYLVSALVTLLVVVDPVGLVPSFLAVTGSVPRVARRQVALWACIIAGAILAMIGEWLLARLGITLHAFRIAGGLLLFAVAFDMVIGARVERQSKEAEEACDEKVHNVAAFPLAIPLMAGPGAITATVLLAGQAREGLQLLALIGVVAVVMVLCLGVFLLAGRIERMLGTTGNVVSTRLLGVLLAALAVQFVIDGLRVVLAGA
jgi:multiple antibiotic resistance protein